MHQSAHTNSTKSVSPIAITVGDALIHYLKLEGVTHIFGIPGGGLMNLLVNLKENHEDMHYVICRQETGAAYMADGYFRATGKMGVVAVTTGPGATNALTGVMNAQADGSALLLITGEIDQKFNGRGYLQEGVDAPLDVNDVYKAAVYSSASLDSSLSAETLIKQAMRNAHSLPRQAAHLSLPVNVTIEPLPESAKLPTDPASYRTHFSGAPLKRVAEAIKAFLCCKRPLIFLGNGCRQALRDPEVYKCMLDFVESQAIPVITTADAKGIFPENHPMSLRVYGMANCMWPYHYMTDEDTPYDGLLVLGSQLGELSTNKWLPMLIPQGDNAPFIQVDANQRIIARSFEVTHGIVGEASAFIKDLSDPMVALPPNPTHVADRKKAIAKIKKAHSPFFNPEAYKSESKPVQPQALMKALQTTIPENTKIFVDAGNCVGWSVHYLEINKPTEIFTSLAMGPMGFAVGAVVGAKHGCPDATCIAFTGDGSFMMQGSEISTARQNNIGAIWLVLCDNNLSMVSQGMEHYKPDPADPNIWHELYELGNPDLEIYARGLGAEAHSVHSPLDMIKIMPTVLQRANVEGIPQVIVAYIDKDMVPPYYNPLYGPKSH